MRQAGMNRAHNQCTSPLRPDALWRGFAAFRRSHGAAIYPTAYREEIAVVPAKSSCPLVNSHFDIDGHAHHDRARASSRGVALCPISLSVLAESNSSTGLVAHYFSRVNFPKSVFLIGFLGTTRAIVRPKPLP